MAVEPGHGRTALRQVCAEGDGFALQLGVTWKEINRRHGSQGLAEFRGQAVCSDRGAKDRVQDGRQVFLHESLGTDFCRVDEDKAAVVWRQFYKSVDENRRSIDAEHALELSRARRWDVALDDGNVDRVRWDHRSW